MFTSFFGLLVGVYATVTAMFCVTCLEVDGSTSTAVSGWTGLVLLGPFSPSSGVLSWSVGYGVLHLGSLTAEAWLSRLRLLALLLVLGIR
jgi:hypothetical protein